ncbi:glycosyltransferase [Micromonospora antibiotica]|uniref:Glycosyltransferase n=1 Tax=Micromonospora antibiotica TaxID=2807623 RepID=A0ABS3V8R8_9ACTN|nr:glycosyltransferase [Micromonospora antibiotica]MBO4162011.1 glycosyltransferase [Micromonospora antibiotica]
MLNHPQLSVVIPTYNQAPSLRKTLTSRTEERDPPPLEVANQPKTQSRSRRSSVTASFDRVVITSRSSRLWPQWGEFIRAEASRIGVSVRCTPALHGEPGTTVSP